MALLLLMISCDPSVTPAYLLDDLKIVAVVAEPPDIAVGQTSALRTYLAAPNNPNGNLTVSWSYCRENDGSETLTTCSNPVPLVADNPRSEQPLLFSLGATIAGDANALTGVIGLVEQAGFWVTVLVSVTTPEGTVVQAEKRLVLSDGTFPRNTNPILSDVQVWAQGNLTTAPHAVHTTDSIQLVPNYDQTAFQQYQVLNSDGTFSQRDEAAQLTWYVSSGTINAWQTTNDSAITWALPSSAANSTQTFICVLRDGRGGTAVVTGSILVGT